MQVNRRTVLKQFVMLSAGAALIPSCMQNKSKASIILKNLQIDNDQERLMAELTETIIPASDTPGAKDISAHLFALKMVDDCFSKEDQVRFTSGLALFDKTVKDRQGRSFIECSPGQRSAALTQLESEKDSKDPRHFFYATTKDLTIQAYTTSQFYLTKVVVYELVPARYHGCVPVTSVGKKAS